MNLAKLFNIIEKIGSSKLLRHKEAFNLGNPQVNERMFNYLNKIPKQGSDLSDIRNMNTIEKMYLTDKIRPSFEIQSQSIVPDLYDIRREMSTMDNNDLIKAINEQQFRIGNTDDILLNDPYKIPDKFDEIINNNNGIYGLKDEFVSEDDLLKSIIDNELSNWVNL